MIFGQLTDVGRKRAHNEDNLAATRFELEYAHLRAEFHVGIVCDGMGGAAGGEIASAIAVEAILRSLYTRVVNTYMDHSEVFLRPHKLLEDVIQQANLAVYQEAHSRPGFSGMGCTATVMLAGHGRVHFAQVGDSRGYLFRGGELTQVTMDHSFVSELMREGRLTAEEAESHPRKSVITRAIGSRPEVEPDVFEVIVQDRDLYLVCSDGLTGMVTDAELTQLLASIPADPTRADLRDASRRLIDAANAGGGTDNISVVLGAAESSDVASVVYDPVALVPDSRELVLSWAEAVEKDLPDASFQDLRLGRRR